MQKKDKTLLHLERKTDEKTIKTNIAKLNDTEPCASTQIAACIAKKSGGVLLATALIGV